MWVSKDSETRKQEFMEAAVLLFVEKGYDKTTVNDIISAVGVTKGSFYYHFQSKEDVVAAVIQELATGVAERVKAVHGRDGLGAPAKLLSIVSSLQGYRAEQKGRYEALYRILNREENHALASRFQSAVEEQALPLIVDIMAQGRDEGAFDVADPRRTALLFLKLSNIYKAEMARMYYEEKMQGVDETELAAEFAFWQDTLERIFGARKGSIPLAELLKWPFGK